MAARRFPLWLLLGCELTAATAWAGEPTELVYVRSGKAEVCPDQAALEQAVSDRLGYNAFFRVAERKIVAEIWGGPDALHARARLVERGGVVRGSRELAAPAADCGELLASLALAISITLDPMSVSRPASAPPVPPAAPMEPAQGGSATASIGDGATPRSEAKRSPPNPVPVPSVTDAPAREVPADDAKGSSHRQPVRRSFGLLARAGALASVGALPSATPGLHLGLEGRSRFLSLAIEGVGLAAASEAAPLGGEARISLLYASVVPCALAGWVKGCAVASFGRLGGQGVGVAEARQEDRFYAAVGLRIGAQLPMGRDFELAAHAGANKALAMPSFELGGVEVWRPPPFSAEAGLSLSLRFL